MKTVLKLVLLALALVAGPLTMSVYAVDCYTNIPSNTTVVLTADLWCPGVNGKPALNIPFGNVIIELRGHTITCVGAWCGAGLSSVGIQAFNSGGSMPNVKIVGPGTIAGFDTGILFAAASWGDGTGLSISQVTISGPGTTGISLSNPGAMTCGFTRAGTIAPTTFSISNNQISGRGNAIEINGAHCGEVKGNLLADNTGGAGSGIRMLTSLYNTISGNFLAHNAYPLNGQYAMLVYGGYNQIFLNYLTSNSAGMVIEGLSNSLWANTVRFTSPGGYDMKDLTAAAGANYWSPNNICTTQYNLPAGVCNPGE